jgi:hypothetical protein
MTPRAKPVIGTTKDTFEWEVTVTNPTCRLKLEVIGAYRNTPDLGYAVIEKAINQTRPPQPAPVTPPAQGSSNIDLSKYKACIVDIYARYDGKTYSGTPTYNIGSQSFIFRGNFKGNIFTGVTKTMTQPIQDTGTEITVTVAPTPVPNMFKITGYSIETKWSANNNKYYISGNKPMNLGARSGYGNELWSIIEGIDTCKYIPNFRYTSYGSTYDRISCNIESKSYLKIHFAY